MNLGISYNDWLASLSVPVDDGNGDAKTAEELAESSGIAHCTVIKRMKLGIRNGWVRVSYVRRTRIDGREATVPAYVITNPAGDAP